MPKRKISALFSSDSEKEPDRAIKIRKSRLKAKIQQGETSLLTALKLARGFERQKLSRRQKNASNEPKTLLRLREEVIILKALDLPSIAKTQLRKLLGKAKRVREAEAFQAVCGGEVSRGGVRAKVEANVVARLWNANPVKDVLEGVVGGVYAVLGLEAEGAGGKGLDGKVGVGKADVDHKMPPSGDDDVGSGDKDSFACINDRIHASSDGEEAEAGDEVDYELLHAHVRPTISRRGETAPSLSISTSRSSSPSPDYHHDEPAKPDPTASKTAFLPSLMLGGYYPGSSSGSDIDIDETVDQTPLRKNRRGQRARQQIAEKKYGAKAKHLQNQDVPIARDSGWDRKRGATETNGHGRRGYAKGRGFRANNSRGPTGANETVIVKNEKRNEVESGKRGSADGNGALHPSWEAAKKRKEMGQSLNGTFMGKKITFD